MDEALELTGYLPISFKSPAEDQYIAFLWDAFETNYTHGKYQFAFLAYHMLTMCYVYFNIWQIKHGVPSAFANSLIGFDNEMEKNMLAATTPFAFSKVRERTILRFLKLIECDNAKIGTYAKLVDDRNDTAHPNGNIFYREQSALDLKIREILRVVAEIESHSAPIIERCYLDFLVENQDSDNWQYSDPGDLIRELLIHEHYFSLRDIDICDDADLTPLQYHPHYNQIESLHTQFQAIYRDF